MRITDSQAKKILTNPPEFSQLGMSMMVTRLAGKYAKEPSEENLTAAMNEINKFLATFSSIIASDYEVIMKL